MLLNIPANLTNHNLVEQFEWIELWANLPLGILSKHANALFTSSDESRDGMLLYIKDNLIKEPWHWPEYATYIEADGMEFKKDLLSNMIDKVCRKWKTRRNAIYRADQIREVIHLRPFLQVYDCRDNNKSKFILSSEDFFLSEKSPINCKNIDCECRINSLSRVEMRMFLKKDSNNKEAQRILSLLTKEE